MFAVGGVFTPDGYGEVLRQTEAVSDALTPWDSGTRYLNFEEGVVDAQVFFDADTWRLLRALRTHWDPNGVLLANHEIKAPASWACRGDAYAHALGTGAGCRHPAHRRRAGLCGVEPGPRIVAAQSNKSAKSVLE